MEKVRMNFMMPKELADKMKEMAKDYGMTYSGLVSMIIKQYFDQQMIIKKTQELPEIMKQLRDIAEKSEQVKKPTE